MPRSQQDSPTVTRSKSPKRPARGDPSPAREGQRPPPKAREGTAAGQGRPEDPQVPRAREVIDDDRTPETDTDRGPDPQEEGRTAR